MKTWKPSQIKFQINKRGTRVAYGWRPLARRWVRMNLVEAEVSISSGEAKEVCQ